MKRRTGRRGRDVEEAMLPKKKKQRMAEAQEIVRPEKKQRTADVEKSAYLVVGHGYVSPAFSVFKIEPYTDGGGDTPVRIPRRLDRLKRNHNMSFVPFKSKDRRWIVGVGGCSTDRRRYGPGTIIFDTGKQLVIRGPEPKSVKSYPILLPIGHKIYALARTPSVVGPLNFVPWFEVLDLSSAREVDDRLTNCKWRRLKRPPFFPWELTPGDYVCPPSVTVKSYAAVGSRILVSVTGHVGTYAFDTSSNRWSTVDDKNCLPFVNGADPHSPGLFLGLSRTMKAIAGYKINVDGAKPLSVVEIPVVSKLEDVDLVVHSYNFLSLGVDRGFCFMSCWSVDETRVFQLQFGMQPRFLQLQVKLQPSFFSCKRSYN
ncbi:uncharacterized protein LOC124664974 [Lolium rigidum]|uniref:uncharacterized protein LOC124664974 n=1 Tax=Lolium rigidum TaxID=89674 RepID=UPI001F5E2FFA|nr:uncharacterized protein LOC124664974 [Lolium rigidum]